MNPLNKTRAAPAAIGALILALLASGCATPGPTVSAPASLRSPASAPVVSPGATTSPAEVRARFESALEQLDARQYSEARKAMETLVREHPQYSGPLTNLGILQARAGDRLLAEQSLKAAVKVNPDNAVAHNWLGTLLRESGHPVAAEQAYLRALSIRPGYPEAQFNLALLYDLSMQRPEDALVAYRAYLKTSEEPNTVVLAWVRAIESRLKKTDAVPSPPTRIAEVTP